MLANNNNILNNSDMIMSRICMLLYMNIIFGIDDNNNGNSVHNLVRVNNN